MSGHVSFGGGMGAGIARGVEQGMKNKALEERETKQNAFKTAKMYFDLATSKGVKPERSIELLNQGNRFLEMAGYGKLPQFTEDDFVNNADLLKTLQKDLNDGNVEAFNAKLSLLPPDLAKSQSVKRMATQAGRIEQGNAIGVLADTQMEPGFSKVGGGVGNIDTERSLNTRQRIPGVLAGVKGAAKGLYDQPKAVKPPSTAQQTLDIKKTAKAKDAAQVTRDQEVVGATDRVIKWTKAGVGKEEIKKRLKAANFSDSEIKAIFSTPGL